MKRGRKIIIKGGMTTMNRFILTWNKTSKVNQYSFAKNSRTNR